ncbi:MAG TPA: hypothetical protein VK489_04305 [Ferruginibacter sp.]|nr:hypothetical protein [Ferruginibacter sp.]
MKKLITGIHHITAIAGGTLMNVDFLYRYFRFTPGKKRSILMHRSMQVKILMMQTSVPPKVVENYKQ